MTDIQVSSAGRVRASDIEYARDKLSKVLADIGRPVLHAAVRLELSADPSLERPAIAKAVVDVDGRPVRTKLQAREVTEAVDLLEVRLRGRLEQLAEHRQALRRRGPTSPEGQWRHGDAPAMRPAYLPRPAEEREILRRKTFAPATSTVDEAIFDMESLDHDFFLFTDADSGQDGVVDRRDGGTYGLQLRDGGEPAQPTAVPLVAQADAAPRFGVDEAREQLDLSGAPWLFFVDPDHERGQVLYRRYDGHYGLITPAG
ncbi:MAG TPA: sigma 54 modulation/S30EA ribosomal C-terminal domain-containing protein [Acidimicrobiales bacterium]|nr:sigma 54 modulation/S30EA ribosomal C-terminal domain-containing protein [Acidimicrobiales bacterium]